MLRVREIGWGKCGADGKFVGANVGQMGNWLRQMWSRWEICWGKCGADGKLVGANVEQMGNWLGQMWGRWEMYADIHRHGLVHPFDFQTVQIFSDGEYHQVHLGHMGVWC